MDFGSDMVGIIDEEKIKNFSKSLESLKSKNILTIRDVVLLLLYSQKEHSIYGRISIVKQMFLLYNEVLDEYCDSNYTLQDPNFVPYDFGPYSFDLMNIVEQLYWSDYIEIGGRRNSAKEFFKITEKGCMEIRDKFEGLPEELKDKLKTKRISWDQWGNDGLLKYVYGKYEKYTEKSKIKDRYKTIVWGRGKG